jgi:hypothetical protein
MAMFNYRIDSFTHVEHLYNTTKPIRGTNIVPLGDRRRKWECIVKESPTCYMLVDYGATGSDPSSAAVVWIRNADGTDTVEFRNETGDYAHTGRYSFLQRCMPMDMMFIVDSGKQYIRHDSNRYYLPKDTGKPVVFTTSKQTGAWTLTSEPHPLPVTRVRVNKEKKAPYKKAIEEYLHWAWTMTPMIEGTMNWDTNREATWSANSVKGNTFRDMLMDDQHEQRTTMLHAFLCELASSVGNRYWGHTNPTTNVSLTSDSKKFRTKFNAWVNHMGAFTDSFEEYREVK